MAIDQLSTANTFEEWLTTTSTLVAVANNLTDNTGGGFVMNSSIFIEGSAASLNVRTLANINTLRANTANLANVLFLDNDVTVPRDITIGRNANVIANIISVNVTNRLFVGGDTFLHGNLTISGNTTLDAIGFNDLAVAGNANIAQTLVVVGNTFASNVTISGNITRANVTTTLNVGSSIVAPLANISTLNVTSGLILTGNAASVNVTSNLAVGGDAFIYGNLSISGNVTLDSLGFDDLSVAGSVNAANLNTSTGNITLLVGQANTAIYGTISAAIDSSIAFAIALG
jgi:hypothetical protein